MLTSGLHVDSDWDYLLTITSRATVHVAIHWRAIQPISCPARSSRDQQLLSVTTWCCSGCLVLQKAGGSLRIEPNWYDGKRPKASYWTAPSYAQRAAGSALAASKIREKSKR